MSDSANPMSDKSADKKPTEIDREVAEKVMGWKFRPATPDAEWVAHHEDWWIAPVSVNGRNMYKEIPPYSTDIAHAWTVVEKMRSDGFFVVVKGNPDSLRFIIEGSRSEYDAPSPDKKIGPTGAWVCEISHPDRIASAWNIDKSASVAICRAALSALSSKERLDGQ